MAATTVLASSRPASPKRLTRRRCPNAPGSYAYVPYPTVRSRSPGILKSAQAPAGSFFEQLILTYADAAIRRRNPSATVPMFALASSPRRVSDTDFFPPGAHWQISGVRLAEDGGRR